MNTIMILNLRKEHSTWVFDDPSRGVTREPFVGKVNEMIDDLARVALELVPKQLQVVFSADVFPTAQNVWVWLGEDSGGNWYSDGNHRGWLCPCMYKYFGTAPKAIYLEIKATT